MSPSKAAPKAEEEPPLGAAASLAKQDDAATKESWVQCDSCNKWRRIPALLADKLEDDAQWHCQDNPNAAFASCGVAQELTNEEIDQEEEDEQVRAPMHACAPCMQPAAAAGHAAMHAAMHAGCILFCFIMCAGRSTRGKTTTRVPPLPSCARVQLLVCRM